MTKKSALILITCPPYDGIKHREALDTVLAFSAFDQPVSAVFLHDGVFQLLNEQKPELIAQKNAEKMLNSLPMFGLDQVQVLGSSMVQRNILLSDLLPIAKEIDQAALNALISEAFIVLTF